MRSIRPFETAVTSNLSNTKVRPRWFYGLIGVLLLGLSVYVYLADPTKGAILPCPLYSTTGLYCPGCGMSRAVHALMHLDLLGAFGYNPLVFFLIPVVIISVTSKRKFDKRVSMMLLILIIGFGIVRNIIPLLQP